MKIKHDITLTPLEIDVLFNMVLPACMVDYVTQVDQDAALVIVKKSFEIELSKHLSKAFEVGTKMGTLLSDIKDTIMYDLA
jgi:hypothetical protein